MSDTPARWRVLIGSRSFGQVFPEHLTALVEAGCEVVPNSMGRAYRAAELLEILPGMDAIITGTDQLTAEVINAAPRLKTIAKHGIGLETIDLAAARTRGIVVSATPEASTDSVADLTMALLLAVARKVVPAHLN
ncbi:MAG: hydroxyacid dehydrogenase, partial [Chloroflexi bacterium]|nr:hydroxyacid dehydrogenase [Chloroflexota bacterium]